MVRIYNLNRVKNTRLLLYSLVFFLLALLAACKQNTGEISLVWKNNRATGIKISNHLLKDVAGHPLKIVLSGGENKQGILGNFRWNNGAVLFEPLIPLSAEYSYSVFQDGKLVGKISVPVNKTEQAPQLISVYPETDTVPENLLKLYLKFSKPMRTGQSLDYIYLLDKNRDTLHRVFLNLQPELWDTTGTVLTLWIDPGRIKRDLVLNRELGNPLKKTERYELIILQQWKDSHGANLPKSYSKKFIAGNRDNQVPDITKWKLTIPKAATNAPLVINTKEALDHYLLQESITVLDADGTVVKGSITISGKDRVWQFTPLAQWKAGHYKLQVNARLEDLAGNNLNRVFDRDITKEAKKDNAFDERGFEVKP